MNIAASIKRPLPVRPIDGPRTSSPTPQPPTQPRGTMQPLPAPAFDAADLAGAIRSTAFQQLQARTRVQPLPVIDRF